MVLMEVKLEKRNKPIFTSRSRQIRISLKEKRNLLLLHIKHFQLLWCFVFPALNCYFIPFAYFSFRIFNLQVLSHHKDITVFVLGKENFRFIIFPGCLGGFSFSTWIIQLTLNLHATFYTLCMKTRDYGAGHLVLLIPPRTCPSASAPHCPAAGPSHLSLGPV